MGWILKCYYHWGVSHWLSCPNWPLKGDSLQLCFPLGTNVRLHMFADIGTRAYGAVICIMYITSDNDVTFVMARNCGTAAKNPTLLLLLELLRFIKYALHLQDIRRLYLRGDSQITLRWLNSRKAAPQYISQWVLEIMKVNPTYLDAPTNVTIFAKTVPISTTIETFYGLTLKLHSRTVQAHQAHGYR